MYLLHAHVTYTSYRVGSICYPMGTSLSGLSDVVGTGTTFLVIAIANMYTPRTTLEITFSFFVGGL